MAVHAPNAIQMPVLAHILEGRARAQTLGVLSWQVRPAFVLVGIVRVTSGLEACSGTKVRVRVLGQRPHQVRMQFLGNGVSLRRIDVNDKHGVAGPLGVHMHTYDPRTGDDNPPEELVGFPAPKIEPGLPLDVPMVRAGYEEFLRRCGLLDRGSWTDPPSPFGEGDE